MGDQKLSEDITSMKITLAGVSSSVANTNDRVDRLDHQLNGNGKPGLVKDIENLRSTVIEVVGSVKTTKAEIMGIINGINIKVFTICAIGSILGSGLVQLTIHLLPTKGL